MLDIYIFTESGMHAVLKRLSFARKKEKKTTV